MTNMNLVLRPSSKGSVKTGSLSLWLIQNRRIKTVIMQDYCLFTEDLDKASQKIYPESNHKRAIELEKIELKISNETGIVSSFTLHLQKKRIYTVEKLSLHTNLSEI